MVQGLLEGSHVPQGIHMHYKYIALAREHMKLSRINIAISLTINIKLTTTKKKDVAVHHGPCSWVLQ